MWDEKKIHMTKHRTAFVLIPNQGQNFSQHFAYSSLPTLTLFSLISLLLLLHVYVCVKFEIIYNQSISFFMRWIFLCASIRFLSLHIVRFFRSLPLPLACVTYAAHHSKLFTYYKLYEEKKSDKFAQKLSENFKQRLKTCSR